MSKFKCLEELYKEAISASDFYKGLALGGGLVVGGGLAEAGMGAVSSRLHDRKKEQSLQAALDLHPKLQSMDQARVKLYFDTLWNFAPDIARDPLSAGSVLYQSLQMDMYGGYPVDTIKTIIDIQSKRNDSKSRGRNSGFSEFLADAGKKQVLPLFKDGSAHESEKTALSPSKVVGTLQKYVSKAETAGMNPDLIGARIDKFRDFGESIASRNRARLSNAETASGGKLTPRFLKSKKEFMRTDEIANNISERQSGITTFTRRQDRVGRSLLERNGVKPETLTNPNFSGPADGASWL